ncbi:sensor histidine kinase [Piscinibacter sp.]|uniref:sensor histidine kinase n=1 Tax=Piscinibacter sp. TaxID=1903157 RepID=UPI002C1ED388|nr:histidine kinase [Albitalea sp.]HUG22777.1 histidine kinase [Albitalea sp.]
MDASAAVREPASHHSGWQSVRGGLQLILAILVVCVWHNGATLVFQITNDPTTFAWLPRLRQQLQASLLLIAPGMLAAWLASRGCPTSVRMCIRTVVAFFLGSAVGHWIVFRLIPVYPGTDIARPVSSFASSLLTCTLIAAAVLGAMYWWRREVIIRQELHRTRMGLLALKADCADAEMLRLRAQIEPHFLFNTMATIVQMYRTDRAAAGRTLARLIDYMSAARAHMRRKEAMLGDELALTEGYLEIQRLRMGARLRYEIEVSPELRGNRVPPAALLTLVENAIKHGLSPRLGGGLLRVVAHRDGVWLALSVSDDGVGFRATSGRGLGLANLRARMLGLYGGDATLRLTGAQEGGVIATMRLPLCPPPAEALT